MSSNIISWRRRYVLKYQRHLDFYLFLFFVGNYCFSEEFDSYSTYVIIQYIHIKNKTSLTSERACVCVLRASIFRSFHVDFGTGPTVCYFIGFSFSDIILSLKNIELMAHLKSNNNFNSYFLLDAWTCFLPLII